MHRHPALLSVWQNLKGKTRDSPGSWATVTSLETFVKLDLSLPYRVVTRGLCQI